RPSAQDEQAQVVLLLGAEAIESEEGERANQAGAGGRLQSVGAATKLDVEVEYVGRHRPAQRAEAAEFGARVEGHKQGVAPDRERWLGPELPAPYPPSLSRDEIARDHAHGPR